jgi:tRNA G18 (ribose-2'-O)-methylase SpoU
MGAQFIHTTIHAGLDEARDFIGGRGLVAWGADSRGEPLLSGEPIPPRLALAVGNEGAGLSSGVEALVSRTIGVHTRPEVESLNVAVATGILLYQLST